MKAKNARSREMKSPKKMSEVELMYNCECPVFPQVTVDKRKRKVEIPMSHKCPTCKRGCLQKLRIADNFRTVTGICDEPGCNCPHVIKRMDLKDFNDAMNCIL
jgi:hypothetical protein